MLELKIKITYPRGKCPVCRRGYLIQTNTEGNVVIKCSRVRSKDCEFVVERKETKKERKARFY